MAHGDAREGQRLRDFVHTEMMLLGERCARLEQQVANLKRDLETAQRVAARALIEEYAPPR